ncbi:MAG: hypothetical protein CMA43_00665 [Euryarchaeota archaeon]|nr:hypothetical protein [Euryarchaeota archaeon]
MAWKVMDLDTIVKKYDLKTNCIGHVGAWKAREISNYKRIFGDVTVIFVEANKKLKPYIDENIKSYENVRCEYIALGSEVSKGILNLHEIEGSTGQSSSLLEPYLHPSIGTETIEVEITTADILFSNDPVDFLSIDVQGYELEVLKGATNILPNVDTLIVEVNRTEQYKDCALVQDLDQYLKSFNLTRVETEWWGDKEDWGDALYIKK